MERGKRLGDYEILEELGRGGMGRVYRVRNVISDRIEAMKVLLSGPVASEDLAARFLREIKVLAALDHPNIAALRTALRADGQMAMVMELVEGQPLSRRLARGPIAVDEAVAYAGQVLAALTYAHAQGVVHRDVKPANMMLTDAGVVKLTDFGIARSPNDIALTATGTTAGSLNYMSPEQVNGAAADARSDLYSVGISLYEMVTGKPPFHGHSDFLLMSAHVMEQPRPPIDVRPDVPRELNGIILRALAKNPVERFQSAEEFRVALQSLPGWHPALETPTVSHAERVGVASLSTPAIPGVDSPTSITRGATVLRPGASSVSRHDRPIADAQVPAMPSLPDAAVGTSSAPVRSWPAHPLLYVALGAILVIVAAAGTGSYLRRAEARSGRSNPPDAVQPPQAVEAVPPDATVADAAPAVSPAAATSGKAVDPSTGAVGPSDPVPAPTVGGRRAAAVDVPGGVGVGASVQQPAPAPAREGSREGSAAAKDDAPAAARDAELLAQAERELDQLVVRAESVNDSVERLLRELAQQGLGLRADISARHRSMTLNVSRAEDAIGQRDASRAERYRALAQRDVEALEKFFGN